MNRHEQALDRDPRYVIEQMRPVAKAWQVPAPKREQKRKTSILQKIFGK